MTRLQGRAGCRLNPVPHRARRTIESINSEPNLARQAPQDSLDGLVGSVQAALDDAQGTDGFRPGAVVGLGVDTTGSTPIPVDEEGG